MMRASSSFSSHSKRTPLTVPCVPTGIKTGVSITERLVLSMPARASPSLADTVQLIGFIPEEVSTQRRKQAKTKSRALKYFASLHLCVFALKNYFLFPIRDQISGAPIAVSDMILPCSFTKTAEGVPNIPNPADVSCPLSK